VTFACSEACGRLGCLLSIGAQITNEDVDAALGALFASLRETALKLQQQPGDASSQKVLSDYVEQQSLAILRLLQEPQSLSLLPIFQHKRKYIPDTPPGSPLQPPRGVADWLKPTEFSQADPAAKAVVYPPPPSLVTWNDTTTARPMNPEAWSKVAELVRGTKSNNPDPKLRLQVVGAGQEGTVLLLPDPQLVVKLFKPTSPLHSYESQVRFLLYNYHTGVVPRIVLWDVPAGKSPYIVMEYLRNHHPLKLMSWKGLFRDLPTDDWAQMLVAIVQARLSLRRHDYFEYRDMLNAGNIAVRWNPLSVKFYEVGNVDERPEGGQDMAFLRKLVNFLLTKWD